MAKLNDLFDYQPLPKVVGGLYSSVPVADKDCLLGVEVELEHAKYHQCPSTWSREPDGSLKLDGMEFVSRPTPLGLLDVELQRLFGGLDGVTASSRCSIHIHMNIRDLEEEELHKLIIVYCIFERSLFRISGDRWKSNYCVPITTVPDIVRKFICNPYNKWYKYSALNLAPIYGDRGEGSKMYGTVEFRMHEGCTDPNKILDWCNILVSMKKFVQTISLEQLVGHLKTMNGDSSYMLLTRQVFGRWADLLLLSPTFKEDIEHCISKSKLIFLALDTGEVMPLRRRVKPVNPFEEEIKPMREARIGTARPRFTATAVTQVFEVPQVVATGTIIRDDMRANLRDFEIPVPVPELPIPDDFGGNHEEELEGDF